MATTPQRKIRPISDTDPDFQPGMVDPADPINNDIHINQNSGPYRSPSGAAGYIVAALVLLLGFFLVLYYNSGTDVADAPAVIQNNTTEVAPETPATPPVADPAPDTTTNTQTTAPQPAAEQPAPTTDQPATTGTGNTTTTTP